MAAAPALGASGGAEADALALAERYAPIVVIRNQSGPCDRSGEAYRPVPVETVLSNPEITLLGDDGAVIMKGPRAQDLAGLGPGTSLDFPGNPRRPGCDFENDFRRFGAGQPNVAYAHVAGDAAAPDRLVLQYWFFWYFDDYVNTHEGDWEFIQIVFPARDAAQALATTPIEVGYSQHSGGERASWTDTKLQREGDHPVVYAGTGSHANYFTSDVYLGRNAKEGFGCDDTTGPSTRLSTEARLLPSTPPDPAGPLAWLLFEGRWGEFQPSPYDAPPGPQTKKEWAAPMVWQDGLRDSSFAIPASTTVGPTATGAFCSVVKVGGRVYTAVTSPLVLVLLVLGLVAVGTGAARSTSWSPRIPFPLVRRRTSGQILREALSVYRRHRRTLLALGAIFIPAAIVETLLQQLVVSATPLEALVGTAGEHSLTAAVISLLVGSAGHLVASAIVVAGVAGVVGLLSADRPAGPGEAYRLLRERLAPVVGIVVVATAAVLALLVSIVGTPVAVYLLIRWAVAEQACAIERLSVRESLARSKELTRGRMWRTTRLAALVNTIGAISGPVVGIVLLFVTGLPLSTINAVSSLVFVVTIPFVGVAMALLFGDLCAAQKGEEPAP